MNAQTIIDEIRPWGSEGYKKILLTHGVREPCFGVKIADLKKIQKRVKTDYTLALELFESGNYDAMYLAGLIADDARMTRKDLQHWAGLAYGPLSGTTVPSVAAGSPHGWAMALKWIESKKVWEAVAGWGTLNCLVSVVADAKLDLDALKQLLLRVEKQIHSAPNAVRYQMNGFVIAVGCCVKPLSRLALETGERIGKVEVDMGDTSCEVPFAPDYIHKVEKRGSLGKKRKSAKC